MVDQYGDIFIVLTKSIENIVSNYRSKDVVFDLSSFKQQCKYIQWMFDAKDYHSKYWKSNDLVECLVKKIKINKDLADIIAGYIDYDKIIQLAVNGRLYCWCNQKEFVDAVKEKKLVSFETPHSESVIQDYYMCFMCDVDGMNKRIFDNFVIN